MSRHLLVLYSANDRERAQKYVRSAPVGTRVEFKSIKRSLPQNDLMWAMLTDISVQAEHNGRKYTPDRWKSVFLDALGQEVEFIPTLDGKGFIPLGLSSSDLSVKEMTAMIDLMDCWGAEHGIIFHAPDQAKQGGRAA